MLATTRTGSAAPKQTVPATTTGSSDDVASSAPDGAEERPCSDRVHLAEPADDEGGGDATRDGADPWLLDKTPRNVGARCRPLVNDGEEHGLGDADRGAEDQPDDEQTLE